MNQKITTKRIAMAGLLAALTAVGSGLRIVIPVSIGGNSAFHLGNIFCALSGILLGPGLGGLAAGIGSAIYDMTNPIYISECWLTFLMKGAYAVAVGMTFRHLHVGEYLRDLISTAAGAVTYAALYLLKSFLKAMIVSGVTAQAAIIAVGTKLPATVFNMAVAILIAPVLSIAIRKALKQNHISLN
ncbi:MAG: ECF transporter S component [Oscillospiraceae bacterium]|nr:ECF transporter S component [Oscillospiraceae bacterium]